MQRMLSDATAPTQGNRRRAWYWLRGLLIFALAQITLVSGPSTALGKTNKLVGVVFDDSGSMEDRTNLPVFGIQMLAASLTRSDQLYGMTFKQFLGINGGRSGVDAATMANPARLRDYMTQFSLTDVNAQQRTINAIKKWAIRPNVGTPFDPVIVMLAFLAQSATTDDDVHLFVFTDGGFDGALDKAGIARNIDILKRNTKAKNLTVHFLAFVANQAEEDKIRAQGIADLLDKTINTNKIAGFENVFYARDFSGLRKQMIDTIARISETELEEAQRKSSIVTRSGSKFVVNSPVTITKVVVISTATDAKDFPQIRGKPPNIPAGSELLAEMEYKDSPQKLRGTDGQLWKAKITHLDPHPALPANKEFTIEFDRQLTAQTTVLFRTDMTIEWSVFDTKGNAVPAEPDGTVTLSADQDYEVHAHIQDKDSGLGPASFQNLPPEADFTMSRLDPRGRTQRSRMQIDKPNDRATSKLRYDAPQTEEVSVSIVMPGFVTARSRAIKIKVIRSNIDITLTPKPLVQCPNCSSSGVELKLTPAAPWTPVMGVTARAVAREKGVDGKVVFTLADPLPTGVRVQVPAAGAILQGTKTEFELPLSAVNPVELTFELDGSFLGTMPDGYKAKLSAKAANPLIGSGGAVFDLRPRPEDAELVFAGTTDGAVGDTPFRVKPDALDGKAGFYVRVLRPLGTPELKDFNVSIAGLAVDPAQQQNKDILLVKPLPRAWCNCFVSSGRYDIDVRFRNATGQEASLNGAMFIEEITPWERFILCLWLIIGVIAILYFIWGVYRFVNSSRFPRRSRILVYPPRKRIEGVPKRLARRPWPWIKPFLVPFLRQDERCRIEGLSLEAGPGCVRILPKGAGGYDNIRRGAEARPIAHYFRDGIKDPLELFWGERLEELSGEHRTFEFLESTDQI
jgi:hypothetical protein